MSLVLDVTGSIAGQKLLDLKAAPIKTNIDALAASGLTAGQIGIAWDWDMVSPTFGTLWSSTAGNAYNTAERPNAVIIITNGEFSTPPMKRDDLDRLRCPKLGQQRMRAGQW